MVLGLQRKPSPFWAQNALPKGVHASSITIALCPVKRGQLHSLPANTFQEFIAYARNNPGKLNYASAGPGGIIHLTTALLASRAGIQMTHVPYKSGAPALNGLLTGEVDVYFGNASELLQQAASGRV